MSDQKFMLIINVCMGFIYLWSLLGYLFRNLICFSNLI